MRSGLEATEDDCVRGQIVTVSGVIPAEASGLVDAHGHVWVEPQQNVPAADPPILDRYDEIREELATFKKAGGQAVLDCQPPGCGRSVERLVSLARDTGIEIVAATGFHLRRYYPADSWVWKADSDGIAEYFRDELTAGVLDADGRRGPRPGFVKTAFTGRLDDEPARLLEAACWAASATDSAVMVHTERGLGVELLPNFFEANGLRIERVILAHMDKRPDYVLHRDLIRAGCLLEYDTFLRPQYLPEKGAWVLLEMLLSEGMTCGVACGLDLAANSMWAFGSGSPGMLGLSTVVVPGLRARGADDLTIRMLTGTNILTRIARP